MSEVKAYRLEELCEITVGKTPSRNNPTFWGDDFPWVSIADMNQGMLITQTKEKLTADGAKQVKHIPKGTVLLSFKLSIGKVAIAGIPLYTNEAIAGLIIKNPEIISPRFLMWTLKSIDLTANSNRAAMGATLNKAKLKEINIPVPSLEEQERFVREKDLLQAIEQKRERQRELLKELEQSIFHQMFEHEQLVQLDSICNFYSGATPSKKRDDYWVGKIPWFSPKDIKNDTLLDSIDHISKIAVSESNLKIIPKNTVVIVVRGMILNKKIPTALLETRSTINQDIKALIPKIEIEAKYLQHAIMYSKHYLLSKVSTSAHGTKKVEFDYLKKLKIPLPSVELQKRFIQIIDLYKYQ